MFAKDILKVLYAPHKVFKQIIQNPKYWGPLLIFVIFLAVQTGFYYNLYSKTNYEQTSPNINSLSTWTDSPSLWTVNQGVSVSSNYLDYLNNSFYGNSSLQFFSSNASSISLSLASIDNVDCGLAGFQNLSLRIKQVDPQNIPSRVTMTLFSLGQSNIYQRDVTSYFSDSSLGNSWNNLTLSVGPTASDWKSSGSPQWGNITGLKVDFTFATAGDTVLRVQGLFFRGIYESPVKTDFVGFIVYILQATIIQFIEEWILFTALMYLMIRGMKGNIVWRPLFIAVGFALSVTIVQSLINMLALSTLPSVNYPVELLTGFLGEAQILVNAISTQIATYSLIVNIVQLVIYVWTVGLGVLIVRSLLPEFSWIKCVLVSAASFIVTILLASLLTLIGF